MELAGEWLGTAVAVSRPATITPSRAFGPGLNSQLGAVGPAVGPPESSGDGWVSADDGELRWGLYGAAGLLLRHIDQDGTVRYLVAKRSPHVHHGGTWGIPGGALNRGETPEDGARREAEEEFAPVPDYVVADVILEDFGGWTYSTVVADVVAPVTVEPASWEHTRTRWATVEQMTHLVLHPGLAGLMPRLRSRAGA